MRNKIPDNKEELPGDDDDERQPSRSQLKRDVKAITELGTKLLDIPDAQLHKLPYPDLIEAVLACKKITKGNARKRQVLHIGKQLRGLNLDPVHLLIDRFDASSRNHVIRFHQLEVWRDRLIRQDNQVMDEILHQLPDVDRQHLRQLVRNAANEATEIETNPDKPPVHFRKLFQYLKSESDGRMDS